MKYEGYEAKSAADDLSEFDFLSIGKSGEYLKRIIFAPTEYDNLFNLAFGDMTRDGRLDDSSVTDNGDRNRILELVIFQKNMEISAFVITRKAR